jgi:hypothetical protein
MHKGALALLIVGIVLVLISFAVVLVSALLPELTDHRVSPDEATMGILPGGCCCSLSGLMVIGAIIWAVVARKK